MQLDSVVFSESKWFDVLWDLMRLFVSGRHEWLHGDDKDLILKSPWFFELSKSQKRTVRELLDIPEPSRKGSAPPLTVTPSPSSGRVHQLTPDKAASWLKQPLLLLVEDPKGGGRLIEYLLLYYHRSKVRRRLGNSAHDTLQLDWGTSDEGGARGDLTWMLIVNGGGGASANEVMRILTRTSSLQPLPLLLILVDSDQRYPSHSVGNSTTSGRVQSVLQALNNTRRAESWFGDWCSHCRVLKKSEVENYLPSDGLRRGGATDSFLSAWSKLSPSHQDFLDLKSGLRNSLKSLEQKPGLNATQDDVSAWKWRDEKEEEFWIKVCDVSQRQGTWGPLFQGQGTKLCRGFSSKLDQDEVRRRDGNHELEELLDWILSAL